MALSKLTILNEQYVLRKMLGDRGQYDTTYLAWNLRKEQESVIVREFSPSLLVDRLPGGIHIKPRSEAAQKLFEYGLNCFIREAEAASLIDHPNVIRQRAFFQENGTAYCVNDFHSGATLSAVLDGQNGTLQERSAFTIMMPLLDGLLAGHRKGLIHGRLSPRRIFLTKSGRPMLLRFHVTQILLARRSGRVDDMMVPGYTPPELLMPDGKKGPWSDVYACGATMYSIITGHIPPFAEERIQHDPFPDILYQEKAMSPGVKKVLYRAMTMDHEERLQSITELKQELLNAFSLESRPYISLRNFESHPPRTQTKRYNAPAAPNREFGRVAAKPEWEHSAQRQSPPPAPRTMTSEEKQTAPHEGPRRYPENIYQGDGMMSAREPVIETNPLGPLTDAKTRRPTLEEDVPPIDETSASDSSIGILFQQIVDSVTATRPRKIGAAMLAACLMVFTVAGTLLSMGSDGGGEGAPPRVQTVESAAAPAHSEAAYLTLLLQADSLQNLANTYLANGETPQLQQQAYEKLNNLYRQMLKDRPGDSAIEARLASLEASRKAIDSSVKPEEAVLIDPPSAPTETSAALAEVYVQQGDSLYALGQWETAHRRYEVAQEYLPEDPYINSMLNSIEERQHQSTNDDQVNRYVTRAQSMLNAKNFGEARRAYELALDLKPGDPALLAAVAQLDSFRVAADGERRYFDLIEQGDNFFAARDLSGALARYEEARAIRPEEEYLKNRIAAINASLNRAESESRPQDRQYEMYRAAGDSLFAALDYEGAMDQYQAALSLHPQDPYLLDRLENIRANQSEVEVILRDENGVYLMPETSPELLDEDSIINSINYPREARTRSVEGLVVVRMIVDEEGRVSNAFAAKGIGFGCDREAIRVMENARFKPATYQGIPVTAWHNHPIVFKLTR